MEKLLLDYCALSRTHYWRRHRTLRASCTLLACRMLKKVNKTLTECVPHKKSTKRHEIAHEGALLLFRTPVAPFRPGALKVVRSARLGLSPLDDFLNTPLQQAKTPHLALRDNASTSGVSPDKNTQTPLNLTTTPQTAKKCAYCVWLHSLLQHHPAPAIMNRDISQFLDSFQAVTKRGNKEKQS